MDFKKSFLILIAVVANAHVIESVTCSYSSDTRYVCEIRSQIIADEADLLQIGGTHLTGRTKNNVTEVEAKESEIHMFPSLIIDQFINLRFLTLANVRMKEIARPIKKCASLYYVYMNRNEFSNLPGGIFASCAALTHIEMEYGRLRSIDVNAFVGTNLRSLYLTGNQIEVFHPSTFAVIPNLANLYLSWNRLTELPEDAFDKNRELFFVNFSYNNLTALPAKLLTNHTQLISISFTGNRITKIYSETFANTPKLQWLDLDTNLIEEIPEFTNLPELRRLTFFDNKVKHVDDQSFKNLPSLTSLTLSQNEIETVSFSANHLPLLTYLTFNTNNLTNITGMFVSLPVNLTYLNLDSNQLTYLQAGSISPISQLRDLRLDYNQIRKIDPEFFRGATNLSVNMYQNECINGGFEINNDLELNTTVAALLGKCYNSGHQTRAGAILIAVLVFFQIFVKT